MLHSLLLLPLCTAIAGGMLCYGETIPASQLDFLLRHSVKLLNIYYHLVANQRPPVQPATGSKTASGKSELFSLVNVSGSGGSGSAKEQATLQAALGYFASDYVYMKLYNILRGANDSYKVSQSRR